MKIQLTELQDLVNKALANQGYTPEESATMSEVLLYAQLRGNNQGVVKLIGPGIPKDPNAKPAEVTKETKVSAYLDSHQTHAMLAVNQAIDIAINKGKDIGVGIVGVKGIHTSSGALGYYARKIADAGLVGIVSTGSMETVAAHGSSEAILGTNPIAIALPTNGEPMVYDITTAAMAYFGVVESATAGRQLPEGIAYDKDGKETVNPNDVMDGGALKSFDGTHKGSGLSVMLQALTGPLMGAYFAGIGDMNTNWGGHLIIAFNPDLFAGLDETKDGVAKLAEKIKATKRLDPNAEIFVHGERGDRKANTVLESGEIEIEENLLEGLRKAAQ